MRTRSSTLCALLIVVVGLVGSVACDNDEIFDPGNNDNQGDDGGNNNNNNNGGGGTADIDVTLATPASGDTNISGTGLTVGTSTFVGSGAGGFDNGVDYTRVQLDATSDGNLRQVLVYFETANGTPKAVTYSWGTANVNENIVYCPAAGCTGVAVNTGTKEVSFLNTALDNNDPFAAPTKFATLSLGMIQYP